MAKFGTDIRLAREMSLLDATLIGVGAMIGAGIFVLIGIAAGVAGPALLLSFVLNGAIALITAMAYAELGSCYHDAGGGYLWVKEGLPKWNGFLSGWMSWFAHAMACSLYAIGFGAYFEHILRELAVAVPQWDFIPFQKALAASVAVLFGYVNFRGASETGKIGGLVTITKIIILLVFSGFGLELTLRTDDPMAVFRDFMPNGPEGVFKAMGLTFIAFQGFEVIAQSSEEIKDPKRNIPRAVFLSLLVVVPIYLLVTVAALGSVRPDGISAWDYLAAHKETALVEVARGFFAGGGIMILVGGLISTISALNATIYSSSRVAYAMGRDRNFPAFFGKIHAERRSPHWSILVSVLLIAAMTLSLPIEDVASAADIMFLLLFLQVNVAMISLRKKRPDLDRGFKTPLFPFLSILGIALLVFLAAYMLNYSLVAWAVTAGWIILGLLVYRFYASSREIEHAKKLSALDRISRREYVILVCLTSRGGTSGVMEIAFALAGRFKASVVFLHVVEVEEGVALHIDDADAEAAGDFLDEAVAAAKARGIGARALIKVAHSVADGIADAVREEDCNLVLSFRESRAPFLRRLFYASMDEALLSSTSEIGVLYGPLGPSSPRTIAAVYGEDPHSLLALELAPALAARFGSELRVIVPADAGSEPEELGARIAQMNSELGAAGKGAPASAVVEVDPLAALRRLPPSETLVVMGEPRGGFAESLLGHSLGREVSDGIECPVLRIKEYQERGSLIASLFKAAPNHGG